MIIGYRNKVSKEKDYVKQWVICYSIDHQLIILCSYSKNHLNGVKVIDMNVLNMLISTLQKAAWQAGVYKGASKLMVNISEEVKAVLYDKQNVSDVCEVNGIVQCKVCFNMCFVFHQKHITYVHTQITSRDTFRHLEKSEDTPSSNPVGGLWASELKYSVVCVSAIAPRESPVLPRLYEGGGALQKVVKSPRESPVLPRLCMMGVVHCKVVEFEFSPGSLAK